MYCELRQHHEDPRCDRPAFHILAQKMTPDREVYDSGSGRIRWVLVCEDHLDEIAGLGWEVVVNRNPRRIGIPVLLEAW